ncbi:MAG: hypothetical protein ACR2OI_00710 [Acidimicrobiia bacterium]
MRRPLVGYFVVAGVSLVLIGVALARRVEPNPDYPPARAVADRFDQAHLAVEAGQISIDQVDQSFEGVEGRSFEHLGSRLGLAGVFDGDCYGMVWRSGRPVSGVVLRPVYTTCQPDSSLISQPDPLVESLWPSWEDTLPDPERSPGWFIPLLTVATGLGLAALTGAIRLILTQRR